MTDPVRDEPTGWWRAHWPAVVASLALAAWMWTWEPISRNESQMGRAILALAAIGMTVAFAWLGLARRSGRATRGGRAWRLVAALLVVLGLGNYYDFDRDFAAGLGDWTDPAYYYLNSKYFDELGYFGLYEAMLLCDAEGPDKVASHIRTVRNLRDYQLESGREALARAPEVKAAFSAERWAGFCHDANYFVARKSRKSLEGNFFVDHGYNPPPPWTLVGKPLCSLVPVEAVKLAAMVDVFLVIGMFAVIGAAWGADVTLLVLLWWLATVSGRWPVMGQSILRFDWVAAIAVGVAALHMRRPALGGVALLWSACSRVFPAVFWIAGALGYAAQAIHERSIGSEARRYVGASLAFGLVVLGLTLADSGVDGWKGSLVNLRMHNDDAEAYSSQKVGAADAIFFRAETDRREMRDSRCGFVEHVLARVPCRTHGDAAPGALEGNGIAGKGVLVHGVKPWLEGLGLLALAFLAAYAWRTRARPERLAPLGALLIFILTTPSYYYYTLRVALVLLHASDLSKRRNQVGLVLLLAIEAVTNWAMTRGWERYTVTGTISWAMALYYAWLVVVLALELRRPPAEAAG